MTGQRAAIGFRSHSGWAALVVVAGSPVAPAILDRRRIEIADRTIRGSVQPYHAAAELGLPKAAAFLERCADSSRALALSALRNVIDDPRLDGHQVIGCGILLSSGRPAASLEATLASHAAIHTAEGEFFREALIDASQRCRLPCKGVREKELFEMAAPAFGLTADEVQRRVNALGKTIGPPWRQDQKYAALAGWLALAGI